MEKEKLTQEIVNTILEEGVDFSITVSNPNLLHRLKILPVERKFKIYPIKMGTLVKISKILAGLDNKQLGILKDKEKEGFEAFFKTGFELIRDDGDKLIKIIAYALYNKKGEPPKRLIQFLYDNLDSKEMLKILILVIRQMDVTAFLACMVSVTGMNLTETKKEKVTSGQQSEEL